MVSTRFAILSAAVAVTARVTLVAGHGYMLIPESQFKDSTTSAWIVQIEPTWPSDEWDGNNQGSVDTYVKLAKENGVTNIRSLLDDTSKYGEDCGFTDPNGTPQDIPTDGTATFSRGMVHVGPCEIWLDDTMVLHNDDCYSAYGGEDQDVKSIFPVDYSSCANGDCGMMRFYWLAFQGVDGDTVWQVYKNCIPLNGGSGITETGNEGDDEETTGAPSTSEEENNGSDNAEEESTEAPSSSEEENTDDNDEEESTEAPSSSEEENTDDNDDDESTEAPSSSEEGGNDDDNNDDDNSEYTPEPTTAATSASTSSNSTSSSTSTTTTSSGVPDGSWPASTGTVQLDEVYVVAAGEVFDGKMQTYERSDVSCEGQTESGGSTAVFQVKPGGTLKNVIIGKNQMEGVHCDEHDCTIENVWWDDVCEDALSIKGGSASSVSTVNGGGARYADDKVIQHNGYGTVKVDSFYAEDFGKLYRSCGTCGDRQRFVQLSNIYAVNPGKSIVTVNDNYGDEATLSNIYIKADDDGYDVCAWSQGSEDGEPEELGAGIKDPLCQYSESDIHIV